MLVALVVLTGFASRAWRQWPRPRDLAVTVFANALMGAIVLPMRGQEPGLATLVEQIATGVARLRYRRVGVRCGRIAKPHVCASAPCGGANKNALRFLPPPAGALHEQRRPAVDVDPPRQGDALHPIGGGDASNIASDETGEYNVRTGCR